MGLFDFLKKKDETPSYDPTNLKITDLNKGFVFEYDLQNWLVEEAYEYDWGDNCYSREFKISDGSKKLFLSVEDDDELFLSISQKIKIRSIDANLPEIIDKDERPPGKIEYNGIEFFLDQESAGYFKNLNDADSEGEQVVTWEYYDEEEKYVLSLEQWGEFDFEASFGKVINEIEISGILPGENNN
ncbi:MAG: DUF4178 domain-containing protein [Rhodothermaceae bacterium]